MRFLPGTRVRFLTTHGEQLGTMEALRGDDVSQCLDDGDFPVIRTRFRMILVANRW